MLNFADFEALVYKRRSVRHYDPSFELTEEQIKDLLQLTIKAPSSYNLQHWKFFVIHDPKARAKLLPIAFNQQQVMDASATIAILGDLEAYKEADLVYGEALKQGTITVDAMRSHVEEIKEIYKMFPQMARDEAFRNASLAAMLFMLTAKAKGYDTCPMGGFDAKQLSDVFHIPNRLTPIMLITVGKAVKEPTYSTFRFPIEQVLTFNSFNDGD